jgi:hypothetical protein
MDSVLDRMVVKLLNRYCLVYLVLVLSLSSPWIGFMFHAFPSFLLMALYPYLHIYLRAYFRSEWLTMSDLDRFI